MEMAWVQQVYSSNESHRPALDHNWLTEMQMFLRHILVLADPRQFNDFGPQGCLC